MQFVDECEFNVEAGDGGDGAVAFRREKFVPFGGPAGGDGGHGGSVILVADEGRGTLADLTHQRTLRAEHGHPGGSRDMNGRAGRALELRVPLGTNAVDATTGEKLGELTRHQERLTVARGGRGGRGNKHFATPVDRAPRRAEPGTPGEQRRLRLELELMADVGLLGFPNVGKSTLIRSVSRAVPKVADYPFTTLEPHLGVVRSGDTAAGLGGSFVIADIPGLVPGASDGHGLGVRFLRHLNRTRALLHLISLSEDPGREPISDYHALRRELTRFDPKLAARQEVVALSKADLPEVRDAYPELKAHFAELGVHLHLVSAAARIGLGELVQRLSDAAAVPSP